MLVGPPGSGKSTIAKNYTDAGYTYVNQDLQGKEHLAVFDETILEGKDVVVDRMNFSEGQRRRYLDVAKSHGYHTSILVLHESYNTCLERCLVRKDHLTIQNEKSAKAALRTFFTKYERVQDGEADDIGRIWPGGEKPQAIICDLDGTLCNLDHRLHNVRGEGKKNWKAFFDELSGDIPNEWCREILYTLSDSYKVVYCSGRPQDYQEQTKSWLSSNDLLSLKHGAKTELFMRHAGDHRQDNIAKEILLDFEILTRYTPFFVIDDRDQVVKMWRSRKLVVLQCADGDF